MAQFTIERKEAYNQTLYWPWRVFVVHFCLDDLYVCLTYQFQRDQLRSSFLNSQLLIENYKKKL
jgi:hypothetical protein